MIKNTDKNLPNTIIEARERQDHMYWEEAIQKELEILTRNKTWEIVEPPREKKYNR